ncbi:unnamed protein product [Protopolystoma xenopodis]|uniref:Uncharacterized protein n=1 Tax=Protopolystoma xenopodis TaxID=117903 RepID=A0A3S5AZS6_9PLAT|nr:unnamed protein product [Protopolystoma xenopodis]
MRFYARQEVLPRHGGYSFGPPAQIGSAETGLWVPVQVVQALRGISGGHNCFSTVVRADLIRLGCGASLCPNLYGNYDGVLLVCDYAPAYVNSDCVSLFFGF